MTAITQHTTQTDVTAINIDRGMAGDSVKPSLQMISSFPFIQSLTPLHMRVREIHVSSAQLNSSETQGQVTFTGTHLNCPHVLYNSGLGPHPSRFVSYTLILKILKMIIKSSTMEIARNCHSSRHQEIGALLTVTNTRLGYRMF